MRNQKINDTNELIYKAETNSENKLTITKGEEGGINWGFGINRGTLLYKKQTVSKDLLHSRGNSTRYFIISYMGKNLKQIHIYVIHFAVHLELTPTLSINCISAKIFFKESQRQFLKWRPSENLISNTALMFFSLHQGCLLSDETVHGASNPLTTTLRPLVMGGGGYPTSLTLRITLEKADLPTPF